MAQRQRGARGGDLHHRGGLVPGNADARPPGIGATLLRQRGGPRGRDHRLRHGVLRRAGHLPVFDEHGQ